MNRLALFAVTAALAGCHFGGDSVPGSTDLMVGQWRSTDHLLVTDMPLARPAAGGDAVQGTAAFHDYYGAGQDQTFTVSGSINGLAWSYVGPPGSTGFPLGDNTQISANPTFTVTFRDTNHMLLLSDNSVQLEFVRQ